MFGWLQALVVLGAVLALHFPLGDYMARALDGGPHLGIERRMYRLCGIDPDREQDWRGYLIAMAAFSVVGIVVLFLLLWLQGWLPWSLGHPGMSWQLTLDSSVSFATNTSWQNYAGETTTGHLAVMAGLGVQGVASGSVGICVALALVRGLVRHSGREVGNFWVDLLRSIFRIMLPLAVIFGLILIGLGVEQNLAGAQAATTFTGGSQTIIGGPIGSWEPIKLMTGDGGGFFNASSTHPFENPTALSNAVEILLMLLIPTAFIRTFGRMAGNLRLSWTLLVVVVILFGLLLTGGVLAQEFHQSTVSQAVGGPVEGTEQRFGVPGSTLFGVSSTATADGALGASYDSFNGLGGGVLVAAMMLGEIAPGGTGSGLYGLIMVLLVTVFLGGLMVGRTPEFLGKRIGFPEMRLVVAYTLVAPTAILALTAIAIATPAGRAGMGNTGAHGFMEILYAYTSNVMGNGSAMAGLTGNTTFYNLTMTAGMLIGRYLPMVFVLALAGRLVGQRPMAATAGTLRAQGVTFVVLATSAALILALLNFLPALFLGPLADGALG
ncbi:potassium-transporting ATPase subunit KdpA [Nocardia africana]|uniref:Potassium-transporting ATPase potassium-binding subunit n=1 Tax=Nocardia africana TaxID=134964 RepID=A0A378WX72_9NOCA|nr:potassium-transporting ATPase subunit KdpA [Nocardia africana]MCC3313704.1 potassium-transporting ATPase subunit KdpA [Nocardia africana]SUA44913.1 potassium-transporting ATPase subunit A [Nocardia africana]